MTNEESIYILKNMAFLDGKSGHEKTEEAIRTAISALESIESLKAERDAAIAELESRKWIPITEKLPEDGIVLAFDPTDGISTLEYHAYDEGARYCGKGFYAEDEDGYTWKVNGITHWMQLPNPPMERDNMTETLLAENEILKRRVAELEAERDKAVKDMRGGNCDAEF